MRRGRAAGGRPGRASLVAPGEGQQLGAEGPAFSVWERQERWWREGNDNMNLFQMSEGSASVGYRRESEVCMIHTPRVPGS